MGNTSFYTDNAVTYTDTNPAGPDDTPVTNTQGDPAPSSFYKGTGGQETALGDAGFVLAVSVPGPTLMATEWLFGYTFDFIGTFAAAFAGSNAYARLAATGSPSLVLMQNGVQFGTITFNGNIGTFACSQTTFQVGDVLEVFAPASPDATLAHLMLNIFGTRVT